MKFKFSIILILFFCAQFGTISWAQQTFQRSLFQYDKYNVNPSFAGMEDKLSLTAAYRTQWQSIEGNPQFYHFNLHLPLYAINGGAGIQLVTQQIGVDKNTAISASYNQVFGFGRNLLSLGFRAGMSSRSIDGSRLISSTGIYENDFPDHNDDFIPNSKIGAVAPHWGVSLYFFSNYGDFGIVFDDYPIVNFDFDGTMVQKKSSITLHGNYFLNLLPAVKMEFFGLFRSDMIQWQTETGIMFNNKEKLFASVLLRGYNEKTMDALVFGMGAAINESLFFMYSYDLGLSSLQSVSGGTHEFLLRYKINADFGKKIPESIIHSPRLYE